MKKILPASIFLAMVFNAFAQPPLRVAIDGMVHDHVNWILGRKSMGDIEIVGIAEPNQQLVDAYVKRYGFDKKLVYPSLEKLVEAVHPEAVLAFNAVYDHLKTVEFCAPRGIPVMVEKPLAANLQQAKTMLALAKKYNIHLLTNYETTWYGSNEKAYDLVYTDNKIGEIRKLVFHTGHQGPVEIGCKPEFLAWLTDPVLNGGGALMDFGCYGANLSTWLFKGKTPESVTAVALQIKPDIYSKVEDEATIILKYDKAQVIIQASWNWPFGRKDMEVYGQNGYVFCKDNSHLTLREGEKKETLSLTAAALPASRNDPFVYFKNVIRGDIKMIPSDLSAPENNETVMKILEAAKLSIKSGKTILWSEM